MRMTFQDDKAQCTLKTTDTKTSAGIVSSSNRDKGGDAMPPHSDLYTLLDLNPQIKEDRDKLDESAIIRETQRNTAAAERYCNFSFNETEEIYPLHQAIKLGASRDVVEAIYNSYPPAIEAKEPGSGNTALYLSCTRQSSPEVVRFLLEKWPLAAREKNRLQGTPLHVACAQQLDVDVISSLLDAWPNAIKEKIIGRTPLRFALPVEWKESSPGLVPFLLRRWPGAAKEQDRKGHTPLHIACARETPLELVKLLLEVWPDAIMTKNSNGQTPLSIAIGRSAPANLQNLLHCVSDIVRADADSIDKYTVCELVEAFTQMRWWGGLSILFDRHKHAVVRVLKMNTNIMPGLLSFIARDCKMMTLFDVIANEQALFTEI